jgi:hypothetical protein
MSGATSLRVSENGRFFTTGDGRPFFWLGDTQWNLWRCHTPVEAAAILENRRAKGFTVVQVMLIGLGPGFENDPTFRVPAPTDHGEAYPDTDLRRPSESFFRHVDGVVEHARKLGIVLVIGLDHPRTLLATPATAREWGRQVGERYGGRDNIVWIPSYTIPEGANLEVTRLIAAGLREGAGRPILMSCHPDPADPYCSSGVAHGERWLDFNSIQTWKRFDLIHEAITTDYQRSPPKPVVMAEGAYEGGREYGFPITPRLVRNQAWWTVMSGGHHSYGHSDNWQVLDSWRQSLDAPGAAQVGVSRTILERLPWWDLVPDQSLLASDAGNGGRLTLAARSDRGDWALVYVPEPGPVSVRTAGVLAARSFDAAWIDPRTGKTIPAGAHDTASGFTGSAPDGMEDALLLVKPTGTRAG